MAEGIVPYLVSSTAMASEEAGAKPSPMPRRSKPNLGPLPPTPPQRPSQLGGRSIAMVAADAAASVVRSQSQRGGGPGKEKKGAMVLQEAVDAVVNSFAKHTQGHGRGEALC